MSTLIAPEAADLRAELVFEHRDGSAYDLTGATTKVVLTPPRGGAEIELTVDAGLTSPPAANRIGILVKTDDKADWAHGLWSAEVQVTEGSVDDVLGQFYIDVCAHGLPTVGEITFVERVVFGLASGVQGVQGETGETGPQGEQGETGPAGPDGDSAYEVAVAAGFVGDEAAWLASLVGPEGPQGAIGPQGDQGPQGDDGATGADGPQGPAGADGADGADGKTVLNGAGAPDSGDGVDGDFYIRTSDWTIYGPKAGGAWGSPTSIIGPEGPQGDAGATGAEGPEGPAGPAGADGKTIHPTSGAPGGGLGVDGDYAIDVAAALFYGPKAAGAWPAGFSIVGPQGAQGDAGPQGDPGADGADGADAPLNLAIVTVSLTTHTLAQADNGATHEFTHASGCTVTVPNTLLVGYNVGLRQCAAGQVTVAAGAGATLRNPDSYTKTRKLWSEATLHVRANAGGSAAEAVINGDLTS